MDFLDIMRQRRSCRAYQPDRTIPREQLLQVIEAGRLTPSGCNAQPWKFVVVDDPEAKEKVCDAVVTSDGATGAPWRHQVSAFILLVEQPAKVMQLVERHYHDTQRFAQGDLSAACMNMCHEAFALGLATCVIGVNEQSKMERHFGIPHGCEVRLVLALGYAADGGAEPPAKVRRPLEEVCCFNRWQ